MKARQNTNGKKPCSSSSQSDPGDQPSRRGQQDISEDVTCLSTHDCALFEHWVACIYKQKAKLAQLDSFDLGQEISITSTALEAITRRHLTQAAEMHRAVIAQQIKALQQGDQFCLMDGHDLEQGHTGDLTLAAQSEYDYCVWVIYQHFCSLAECNSELCSLVEALRKNSEGIYFQMYRDLQTKGVLAGDQNDSFDPDEFVAELQQAARNRRSIRKIDQITSLIDQYQFVRLRELHALTLGNLIPTNMPKINSPLLTAKSNSNLEELLYNHMLLFESSIYNIVECSQQNMRKFVKYLEDFKTAIKDLMARLQKAAQDRTNAQEQHQKRARDFQQLVIEEQIQRKIETEIRMEQAKGESLIFDENEQELVRNIQKRYLKINQKQVQSAFQYKNPMESIESSLKILDCKKQLAKFKIDIPLSKSQQCESRQQIARMAGDQKQPMEQAFKKVQSAMKGTKFERKFEQLKTDLNQIMSNNSLDKKQQIIEYLKTSQSFTVRKMTEEQIAKAKQQRQRQKLRVIPNLHDFIEKSGFKNEKQDEYLDEEESQFGLESHEPAEKKKKKRKKRKKNKPKPESQAQSSPPAGCELTNADALTKEHKLFSDVLSLEIEQSYMQVILNLVGLRFQHQTRKQCYEIDEDFLRAMKDRQTSILQEQRAQTDLKKNGTKTKRQ